MNTPNNSQLDTSPYANVVQDILVTNDNMPQTTTSFHVNEIMYPDFNIQAMTPNHASQSMQDYQQLFQKAAVISEYSFFYTPCNDFQMYHIICEEIPLSFELVSQLINSTDSTDDNSNPSNNIYVFYYEQRETKKIYQITCEMVSHTFMFQFLNKIIYGIQSTQSEHQQQVFSKKRQESLKFHLKKDLIHYLAPKQAYEQRYNLFKEFIQDYRTYENMINSNMDAQNLLHFQQDNSYGFQNCVDSGYNDSYNDGYYNGNFFQS